MSNFQLPASWESVDQKISQALKQESFERWADKGAQYISRNKKINPRSDNVIRVLGFPEVSPNGKTEMIKEFGYSHNLVTDDGEIYYAIQGAGETPAADEDFSQSDSKFELGSTNEPRAETDDYSDFTDGAANPIASSIKSYTSGYPKTNDTGDADNTGDGTDVVSYAVNYTTGDFNDTDIESGVIVDSATPGVNEKLLSHFGFTSFAKSASDTLKVFVNHAFENV